MAFVAGQKLRVSDLTGGTTGAGSTGNGTFDRVTADVTINNSTTFVDSGLAIDVAANAVYEFYGWLRYTGGNTPDFKVSCTTPSGTTGFWSLVGNGKDTAPATDTGVGATYNAADIGTSLTVAGDATGTLLLVALAGGSFATSSTAGTLKIRVAQRTATASNTVLKTFSYLRVTRID
jgi:hypothetical protein